MSAINTEKRKIRIKWHEIKPGAFRAHVDGAFGTVIGEHGRNWAYVGHHSDQNRRLPMTLCSSQDEAKRLVSAVLRGGKAT